MKQANENSTNVQQFDIPHSLEKYKKRTHVGFDHRSQIFDSENIKRVSI